LDKDRKHANNAQVDGISQSKPALITYLAYELSLLGHKSTGRRVHSHFLLTCLLQFPSHREASIK